MTSMRFLMSSVHVKHNNFVGCLLCHLSSSLGVWSLVSLLISGALLFTFRNLGVSIYPVHIFIQILLCFSWLLSQNNMEKYEDDEEKRYFNFKESLWFCMTSLTPQVLYPPCLRSIWRRVVIVVIDVIVAIVVIPLCPGRRWGSQELVWPSCRCYLVSIIIFRG